MKILRTIWGMVFFLLYITMTIGQSIITGSVSDYEGNALVSAKVILQESGMITYTDELGLFSFEDLTRGSYTVSATYTGLSSELKIATISNNQAEINLDFVLTNDPWRLSQITIVDRGKNASSLQLSQNLASLSSKQIDGLSAYGSADLLSNLPGVYADASSGEIFTRIYSRGISISAEDDLGWYYAGLEEDGLPVTATQHVYYSPDLFHRADLSVEKVESINGGKSSILGVNAPGTLFNFKSKTGGKNNQGNLLLSTGIEGNGNIFLRNDLTYSGPISNQWQYFVGGFYRKAEGARDVDLDWQYGGQIKANITRKSPGNILKIYGKYLHDHSNRWTGLPATNWDKPQAAFGTDFSSSALMIPSVSASLPYQLYTSPLPYDTDHGVLTKDLAIGVDYLKIWSKWSVRNNIKYTEKEADWQTSIGNQPLGLESFNPYLLSGISPDFSVIPLGNVVFRDVNSGEVIARVNNEGILGPFTGDPATFEYLEGSLPNDAVMGTSPWKKIDQNREWMNRLTISGYAANHHLTSSAFYARSEVNTFTSGSFAYATYEPQPRLLRVTLENPGDNIVELSDQQGISNYGGLFYNQAEALVNQWHIYINDSWQVTEKWNIDAGMQWSSVNQNGTKENPAPLGDLDANPNTAYNNSTLGSSFTDEFELTYNNLSWSTGLLYEMSHNASTYVRYTDGRKGPELNYVFNNFTGIPVGEAGTTQKIRQWEWGLKSCNINYSMDAHIYYSRLRDVSFSEFVLDENGTLFFTPEQLNSTSTLGINVHGNYVFSRFFQLLGNLTLQNPKAETFTIYQTMGTINQSDDDIEDYSGNTIPHNPKLTFEIQPLLQLSKNKIYIQYAYIGERQANIINSVQLPGFGQLHAGIDFAYSDQLIFSLSARNLLNNEGLMNFYGLNEFGSSANNATADYVARNPEASFVVFPILPRRIYFKANYSF